MSYRSLSSLIVIVLVMAAAAELVTDPVAAQESVAPPDIAALLASLNQGDRAAAKAQASELLRSRPGDLSVLQLVADTFLRCGEIERSVELYERYARARPGEIPFLWQRGIALTLAGRYEAGTRQFEQHQTVNPHDVENAAWHFLCVAKADGIDAARKQLLPAPHDPRPTMKEVLEMFKSSSTEPVIKRIESYPKGSLSRRQAVFYGNLHLAMDADARGEIKQAIAFLKRSIAAAEVDYMGDVARSYFERLTTQAAPLRNTNRP